MEISRRSFIGSALALTGGLAAPAALWSQSAKPGGTDDVVDEALRLLSGSGPEYGGGLSNHAPMVVDALAALNRPEAILSWVADYRRTLQARPSPRTAVTAADWHEALGDSGRVADWTVFFDREMRSTPWPGLLDRWSAVLAPGLAAAAAHGLLRTAHAARSLAHADTPRRRHELAEGLGYWAARYQRLPDKLSARPKKLRPFSAIAEMGRLPMAERSRGLIVDRLRDLDRLRSFSEVADLVDVSGDPGRLISELTETFARVYLANARDFGSAIVFVHCVTAPSALRLLVPHVSSSTARSLLRYAWQTSAALYAAFAVAPPHSEAVYAPDDRDVVDRAIAAREAHAIKFTEACLREHAESPADVYIAGARHATNLLRMA